MKKQTGLTLIELMVATIILAILASAGVPALKSLFGRNNITAVGGLFEKSIQLARTEAVRIGQPVRVKPGNNGTNWANGWHIEYTDVNNVVQMIRQFDAIPNNPLFTSNDFTTNNPLVILPNGQVTAQGRFSLAYANCSDANQKIQFDVLLSGILKRTLLSCP